MRLVYPDDPDSTLQERTFFTANKALMERNAYVWQSKNIPLPWLKQGFGMQLVRNINNEGHLRNTLYTTKQTPREQDTNQQLERRQPVMDPPTINGPPMQQNVGRELPEKQIPVQQRHESNAIANVLSAENLPAPGTIIHSASADRNQNEEVETCENSRDEVVGIRNPPRRLLRVRDPGQAGFFNTTRERKRRKLAALRNPVRSRGEQNRTHGPSGIDEPLPGAGWACPACVCLEIQASSANVLQHWRASHRGSVNLDFARVQGPTEEDMRSAAVSFEERARCVPQRGQIIEVLWNQSESCTATSWYRGKVTSVIPMGARNALFEIFRTRI